MTRFLSIFLVVVLGSACSSLPAHVEREPSWALDKPEETTLGKMFSPDIAEHAGESGFIPVLTGTSAFLLRSAFAGLAEQTLDLQYYIWENDLSGRLLLLDVLKAADRGVRVRMLLDDMPTEGETDLFGIANAHPNIQVRLFNPFANRDMRMLDVATDGFRLNHRMHNKVIIPDNALAITGGRNIGDNYFAVDETSNFRDLDLLVAGPAVQKLSEMFDVYWNSEWAYPVDALDRETHAPEDVDGLRRFLENWQANRQLPWALDADREAKRERVLAWREEFMWGPARTVYDSPARVEGEGGARVAELLFDTTNGVQEELLIETAYFIPGDAGVTILDQLVARGVSVRALTNSLATNDVLAAHAGYMQYREALLDAGVDLYELRPDALTEKRRMTMLASGSDAALHTKALVYDRRAVFVGSFNLDPRSLAINTEMGLLIESRSLAEELAVMIENGMQPGNSYRVEMHDGELAWVTREDGKCVSFTHDPHTSWWQRFKARFIALFPISSQL